MRSARTADQLKGRLTTDDISVAFIPFNGGCIEVLHWESGWQVQFPLRDYRCADPMDAALGAAERFIRDEWPEALPPRETALERVVKDSV